MAKKKTPQKRQTDHSNAYIENAGIVLDQQITETLEKNYMPYAMSVIVSRAIPEIDGFKPSHRKLLYTMYKMGLLTGNKTKSANVVGQTMRLNPHGDTTIYDTMVRLSRGHQALLHPFVDSKGNFGKSYSRDMAYAASRYTEVKLDNLCQELFSDIDKDTVDFVPNYDNTTKEPTLLPVSFPSILVNANMGIAVGMASSICPFNLQEVCETAIGLIKDSNHPISSTLKAPDFPLGGYLLYDQEKLDNIYRTGRGGFQVRCRYRYDPSNNCIEIIEIPPTTTVEAIIDKIIEHVKSAKIKEISDIRDETDLNGLKITIDLKRGIDADRLMQKLYKITTLEDTFSCNFNILIAGSPRVMGVRELLLEWIAFRTQCVKRRLFHDLKKKREKLHLLEGLAKILVDIDKAIRIVRETPEEREVVANLMIGFGIDELQADYVAEIKLRQLNREHILKRTQETTALAEEIAHMEEILSSDRRTQNLIVDELKQVIKKYAQPRKTMLLFPEPESDLLEEEEIPSYPVHLFFTKEGYFKKITPQSLRMSSEQKLKQGDEVQLHLEANNAVHLLFFTNRQQVYKSYGWEFEDTKASVLGEYVAAKLGMEEGEIPIALLAIDNFQGYVLFVYENGKVAKIELSAYETKTKRKKLLTAYSDKSPLVQVLALAKDQEVFLKTNTERAMLFHTSLIAPKATKNSLGISVFTLKKNAKVDTAFLFSEEMPIKAHRFRAKSIPGAGAIAKPEDLGTQLSLE